jgi:hypothetical protein
MAAFLRQWPGCCFGQTWFLRPLLGPPEPLAATVQLHGTLFFGWTLLFITQVGFVATRRQALHRRLGQLSLFLFTLMVVSGLWTAWDGSRNGSAFETATGRPVLLWPLANLLAFMVFYGLGYRDRRRPDFHKRWMLLATVAIAVPALVRIGRLVEMSLMGPLKGLMISNLLLLLLVLHDLRSRGGLHPATIWGGGLWLLSQPLRWWVHHSPAWLSLAERILMRN